VLKREAIDGGGARFSSRIAGRRPSSIRRRRPAAAGAAGSRPRAGDSRPSPTPSRRGWGAPEDPGSAADHGPGARRRDHM